MLLERRKLALVHILDPLEAKPASIRLFLQISHGHGDYCDSNHLESCDIPIVELSGWS